MVDKPSRGFRAPGIDRACTMTLTRTPAGFQACSLGLSPNRLYCKKPWTCTNCETSFLAPVVPAGLRLCSCAHDCPHDKRMPETYCERTPWVPHLSLRRIHDLMGGLGIRQARTMPLHSLWTLAFPQGASAPFADAVCESSIDIDRPLRNACHHVMLVISTE